MWVSSWRVLTQAPQHRNTQVEMDGKIQRTPYVFSFQKLVFIPSCLTAHTCFSFIQEVHEDPGQAPPSTEHPEGPVPASSAPEPAPAAGSQAEKAIPSKSLLDWLRQQADYSLEVPGFGTVSVVGATCHCHFLPADLLLCLIRSVLKETRRFDRDLYQLRASFSSLGFCFLSLNFDCIF